ncbi:Ydc2-catalyt-domain-containing protein [Lophiostoma macrostomum CBS 122681]|uniref:Ydc2-catalyt-domain-containing protein n=1 Tax=Lophiostoma macrostomum CBS 122681 TaxID=1314788 RepID=A0A6A6SNG2_9PLEO|nr:Ydc2-catalyt-domain-containing protein [Lophiostoma macrostomum CBS 122681]
MAPKASAPTVSSVKKLLMRIGSATSGRKNVLLTRLSHDLGNHKMPLSEEPSQSEKVRILSIDMGIKNLAFCIADVHANALSRITSGAPIPMKIEAWRRLDVVEEVTAASFQRSESNTKQKSEDAELEDDEAADPYTPSTLSRTAYQLIMQTFLPYKPDVVLIERQRWRSAGGPSIQQWTVRVNTLEGMLWALFTGFRERSNRTVPSGNSKNEVGNGKSYDIWGVDPKRVGNFWSSRTQSALEDEIDFGPEGEVTEFLESSKTAVKTSRRGAVEKKAKIELLRSWLLHDSPATQNPVAKASTIDDEAMSPAIAFSFSKEAESTRKSLLTEKSRGGRAKGKSVGKELRKLDDVTDCLLQAAAWVAWEGNKLTISQQRQKEEEVADLSRKSTEVPKPAARASRTSIKKTTTPKTKKKKEKSAVVDVGIS